RRGASRGTFRRRGLGFVRRCRWSDRRVGRRLESAARGYCLGRNVGWVGEPDRSRRNGANERCPRRAFVRTGHRDDDGNRPWPPSSRQRFLATSLVAACLARTGNRGGTLLAVVSNGMDGGNGNAR